MFTAKELRIHQKVRVGCQAPLPHTKKRKEPKKKQIFYVQWGTGPIKKAPAYLVKHMQSLSKNHQQEKYDTFSSSLVDFYWNSAGIRTQQDGCFSPLKNESGVIKIPAIDAGSLF